MQSDLVSRRRFVVCAFTASAALASGVNLPVFRGSDARAATARGDAAAGEDTLTDMIRALFPHQGLAHDVYAEIVDAMLSAAADDPQFDALLNEAVEALDAAADTDFFELTEEAQVQVLQTVADTDFFKTITAQVRWRLYSHPKLWKIIGYPGSSVEHGGYVERGFDDIDWLPEDA